MLRSHLAGTSCTSGLMWVIRCKTKMREHLLELQCSDVRMTNARQTDDHLHCSRLDKCTFLFTEQDLWECLFLTGLQTSPFPLLKQLIFSSFTYLAIYLSSNWINFLSVIYLSCQPKLQGVTQMLLIPAEKLLLKCLRLLLKVIIFY